MKTEAYIENYSRKNRVRSGVALGGLGCGSVELRKDGGFYNWRIFNNWPKGSGPHLRIKNEVPGLSYDRDASFFFFVVRYQEAGKQARMKVLNLCESFDIAGIGHYEATYIFPWLTPVAEIKTQSRFPIVCQEYTDPEMPLKIKLEALSPFIPHDAKNSSLPGIYFNFTIESLSENPVEVTLISTLRNLIGYHTNEKYFIAETHQMDGLTCIQQKAGGMDEQDTAYGSMGLSCLDDNATWYTGWGHVHPYYEYALRNSQLPNIDDTKGKQAFLKEHPEREEELNWWIDTKGRSPQNPEKGQSCCTNSNQKKGEKTSYCSIASTQKFSGKGESKHGFILTWHFPNNYNASSAFEENNRDTYKLPRRKVGHYYDNFFADSLVVAEYLVANKTDLLGRTKKFQEDYYESDAEAFILDQVNVHLNTLVTNSNFCKNGDFGMVDDSGLPARESFVWSGFNPDLSVYCSIMAQTLFPELYKTAERAMVSRQHENGMIGGQRSDWPGDMIQIILRQVFLDNNTEYLQEMWPALGRVVDYALTSLDKDGDGIPDIGGLTNHCSYDNFPMFGLASYVAGQWLSAMTAMLQAAAILGDQEAVVKYTKLVDGMRRNMLERLWNGEYFRLFDDTEKGQDEGCLTDQLLGQWTAQLVGLGELHDKEKVQSSLKNILERNLEEGFILKNATWPQNADMDFPPIERDVWIDQANTPWTGVELPFASFLIYEGFYEKGLSIIKMVDDRYRQAELYWDHQEAYGRYYRSCGSWGILNALLGLSINMGTYSFAPKVPQEDFKLFFATPHGTAHFAKSGQQYEITICSGELKMQKIIIKNAIGADLSINGKLQEAKKGGEHLIVEFDQLKTFPTE